MIVPTSPDSDSDTLAQESVESLSMTALVMNAKFTIDIPYYVVQMAYPISPLNQVMFS